MLLCRIAAGGDCVHDPTVRDPLLPGEQLPSFATVGGWYYYRLQTERGSLLRFFWSADHTRWVVQNKSGATSEYGVPADSTDTSATDRDSAGHIFRWNLIAQYDAQRTTTDGAIASIPSNYIRYNWIQQQASFTVSPQQPPTVGTSLGYLSDIYDTGTPSVQYPTTGNFAHHTHLVYQPSLWTPSQIAPVWLAQPAYLLARVDVTSQDYAAAGQRQQVRRYYLDYNWCSLDPSEGECPTSVGSVQMEGNCPPAQNNFEDPTTGLLPDPQSASTCPQKRPPATFLYHDTGFPPESVVMPSLTNGSNPPLLFDINNDGLPDVIDTAAQPPVVWLNSVSAPNTFVSQPVSLASGTVLNLSKTNQLGFGVSFGTGAFQMDGQLDMLWSTQGEWAGGAFPFTPAECPKTPSAALYCDPLMSYALITAAQGTNGWTLTPAQTGTFPLTADWPDTYQEYSPKPGTGWFCSSPPCVVGGEQTIATMDMNGDGIADLLNVINYTDPSQSQPQWWWQYTIRFSKRSLDGTYWPFAGTDVPWASQASRTDVSVAGVAGNAQDNAQPVWNQNTLDYAQNQFADVDGDGIMDMVTAGGGSANMMWWPGHGDGVFGFCIGGGVQCASTDAIVAQPLITLPTNPNLVLGVHDVTGDGLADVIVGDVSGGGILYYENLGGFTVPKFTGGTPLNFPALGMSGPPTAIYFADMDGNGIDDVILQGPKSSGGSSTALGFVDMHGVGTGPNSANDTTSIRVGALTDIYNANGFGSNEHITYDSAADLARAATAAGAPWARPNPRPMHVVTNVTTTDTTGDSYTTSYAYRDPVFDGRDQEFLGFQQVTTTTPGTSTTLMNTRTTYFYGACGTNEAVACSADVDYPQESYRALPTLTEVFDGNNELRGELFSPTYLSTTHHSYAGKILYQGADGRVVRRIYDAQTDAFLYDTSPFAPSTLSVSIPDVDLPGYASPFGVVLRSAYKQIEVTRTLDGFGNITTVNDLGLLGSDPGVYHQMAWEVPAGTDTNSQWIWRPYTASVGASAADPQLQRRSVELNVLHGEAEPSGDLADG